MKYMGS